MTAVEYILNLMIGEDASGKNVKVADILNVNEIQQAKKMEEVQKIQFANEYSHVVMAGCLLTATEYYKETFKSK